MIIEEYIENKYNFGSKKKVEIKLKILDREEIILLYFEKSTGLFEDYDNVIFSPYPIEIFEFNNNKLLPKLNKFTNIDIYNCSWVNMFHLECRSFNINYQMKKITRNKNKNINLIGNFELISISKEGIIHKIIKTLENYFFFNPIYNNNFFTKDIYYPLFGIYDKKLIFPLMEIKDEDLDFLSNLNYNKEIKEKKKMFRFSKSGKNFFKSKIKYRSNH